MQAFHQVSVERDLPRAQTDCVRELKFTAKPRQYLLNTSENFRNENVSAQNAVAGSDCARSRTLGYCANPERTTGAAGILPRHRSENTEMPNFFRINEACSHDASRMLFIAIKKLPRGGHVRINQDIRQNHRKRFVAHN